MLLLPQQLTHKDSGSKLNNNQRNGCARRSGLLQGLRSMRRAQGSAHSTFERQMPNVRTEAMCAVKWTSGNRETVWGGAALEQTSDLTCWGHWGVAQLELCAPRTGIPLMWTHRLKLQTCRYFFY
eukprot:scaffold22413_cov19-Tisochrysis_lutea.AAC.1